MASKTYTFTRLSLRCSSCSEIEEDNGDDGQAPSLVEAHAEAQAAVNKAQQVLHTSLPLGHEPGYGPSGMSANSALATAAAQAVKSPPLVVLPVWVRMPSNAAQHWLSYTALGLVSAWAGHFVYK